jgi:hypothetical protein
MLFGKFCLWIEMINNSRKVARLEFTKCFSFPFFFFIFPVCLLDHIFVAQDG